MDQLGRPVIVTLTRYGAALAREIAVKKKDLNGTLEKTALIKAKQNQIKSLMRFLIRQCHIFKTFFLLGGQSLESVPQVSSCGHCLDF